MASAGGTISLVATPLSAGQISLHWSDVTGEVGYCIMGKQATALVWDLYGRVGPDVTRFDVWSLGAGTTYQFYVETTGPGPSVESNVASATTAISTQ
jgi:hypothetical protein